MRNAHTHSLLQTRWPLVLGLAAVVGCSSSGVDQRSLDAKSGSVGGSTTSTAGSAGGAEQSVTIADAGKTVALSRDQQLVLALPANPSAGMSWGIKATDDNVLALATRGQDAPKAPGQAAVETLRFIGVTPGRVELTLALHRPWEDITDANTTFKVTVDVAGPYTGKVELPQAAPPPAARTLVPQGLTGSSTPSHYNVCDPGDGSNSRCTPIKDQGQCGSCWAFATVGVFENLLKFASPNKTPDLSEQYLVSCNEGQRMNCENGGWAAFDYFKDKYVSPQNAAGAVYEQDLPYTASDGSCNQSFSHGETVSNFVDLQPSNHSQSEAIGLIKDALMNHGPVFGTVYVDNAFFGYQNGILKGSSGQPNHAIVITGWDDNGGDGYWIVRNSWGSGFGENGYLRIGYGSNNIESTAVYAELGSSPPPAPPSPGPSPAPGPAPTGDHYQLVSAMDPNLCADVAASGTTNGTNIRLWQCNGTGAQSFHIDDLGNGTVHIVNDNSRKCMDIAGGRPDPGTNVQQWSCYNGAPQGMRLDQNSDGTVSIVNNSTGGCVDVFGGGRDNGTNIIEWTCHGGINQRWNLVKK